MSIVDNGHPQSTTPKKITQLDELEALLLANLLFCVDAGCLLKARAI